MKPIGDKHRQQALFDEQSDFIATKPLQAKLHQPKSNKAAPPLQPRQVWNNEECWDEQTITAAFSQGINPSPIDGGPALLRPKKKHHWWLRFTALLTLLLLTIEGVRLVNQAWLQESWITALYASLFFLVIGGGLLLVLKEIRKLNLLSRTEHHQLTTEQISKGESCDDIVRYCQNLLPQSMQLQLKEATQQWRELIDDSHSDQDVLRLYQQVVMKVCDERAKLVIQQWSTQAALMVAVSPLVALDMLLIAWRNIRMMDEIAACYGLELGLLSRLGLLKLVIYNLLYAGVSELAIDLGLQSIGADLAGKFSARAAQGLGAGLLSARLGIKAMQVCRPVAFSEPEHPPRLSQIAKGLRKTLLKQIVPTGKKQAELE